jgi:glyoxylase-like metal-dependent hydrolase (beta-lactamase superfamily II)
MDAADWYRTETIAPGVTRITEPFVHPYFSANFYHVAGRDRDLVFDTGMGIMPLAGQLPLTDGKPVLAVASHIHVDHVGALHEFDDRAGPAAEARHFATMDDAATLADRYRRLDKPLIQLPNPEWLVSAYRIRPAPLGRVLAEADTIDLGDRAYTVLHLPGHSPGCIALLDQRDGVMFSGDAIYDDELLDELPGSDRIVYRDTMRRLLHDVDISIGYGGHGPSFGRQRMRAMARAYLERTGGV